MANPTPEAAKNHALHGLRGLMSWWVVLGHVSLAFGWHLPIIDRNGLAVDVFVLLSGYVIALLVIQKAEPYPQYIVRRGFRLFPLYLVMLAISTILLPVQYDAWSYAAQTSINAGRIRLASEGLTNLPFHLAMHIPLLQGIVPEAVSFQAAYTLIGQAWSVSLEWQFYIVAPLLIWSLTSRRRWPIAIIAVLALFVVSFWFPKAFLGARILHFMLGIITYFIVRGVDRQAWMIIALLLTAIIGFYYRGLQMLPILLWALVTLSSVQPTSSVGHAVSRLLSSSWMFRMGEISYSVYLVHMIPLYCGIYLFTRLGFSGVWVQAGTAIFTILTTYVVSMLTFKYIEQPGIALGGRISRHLASRPVVQRYV